MKRLLLSALVLSLLGISACKKDDKNPTPPPPVTDMDLITDGLWKTDTIAIDANKDGVIDTAIPDGFEPCDLDNTILFNNDSTGVYDEGPLKCASDDPQSIPFTWYFKGADSSMIYINGLPDQLNGDIDILELTENKFVMSKEVVVFGTTTANLIVALKR